MNPKVFISYSWDNKEHEDWVLGLVADLRKAGMNAELDKSITQTGNIHLDKMMVDGFKNYDKVILVLTEQYAKKADNNQGGVGFETLLSLPVLKTDPNKLIPISRHSSSLSNSMPFHLKGYYAIDFSNTIEYFEKFIELKHKICEVNQINLPKVGILEDLNPKEVRGHLEKSMDSLIPDLTVYKEQDKKSFLVQEMSIIWDTIIELSNKTDEANLLFDYVVEVNEKSEKIIYFRVNNVTKTGIHMRLNDNFGRYTQIILSFNTHLEKGNSSHYNEMIDCNINDKNELELTGLAFSYSSGKAKNPSEIAKKIWKNNVVQQLKL